ncbi:MAG: hypothetical protein CL769_02975 [Chloroflexi bacterium]|nr:hypothetical protein [Chloroflexota bacterium]
MFMLDRIYSIKNTPGFFFIYILLFCLLGLTIMGLILGWVYSDISPRNESLIKYEGSVEYEKIINNNFSTKKEIHNYRFQGLTNQLIDIKLTIDPGIRYGTKVYLNNPSQTHIINSEMSYNILENGKAVIGNSILLKNDGTFTLSIDYDFKRHSNYYDFDYFFMFWDRDNSEWVNKFPEYNFKISLNRN